MGRFGAQLSRWGPLVGIVAALVVLGAFAAGVVTGGSDSDEISSAPATTRAPRGVATTIYGSPLATSYHTTTTIRVSSTLSLEGEGEPQFLAFAREAGAIGSNDSNLTLGRGVCEFARRGILDSYVTVSVLRQPVSTQEQYSIIMAAAALKLCPDQFEDIQPVIQRVIQRLAGN